MQLSAQHLLAQPVAGIYWFNFLLVSNCYLIEREDGFDMIDTSVKLDRLTLQLAIQNLGKPLRRLLLTHSHPDHAGNAAFFHSRFGTDVYCSAKELPFLRGEKRPGRHYREADFYHRFIGIADNLLGDPVCRSGHAFSDNPSLLKEYDFIDMAGHTPGSTAILHKPTGSVFFGDALLNSQVDRFLPEKSLRLPVERLSHDYTQALQSLRQVADIPFSHAFFGHGPPLVLNTSPPAPKEKIASFLREHLPRPIL